MRLTYQSCVKGTYSAGGQDTKCQRNACNWRKKGVRSVEILMSHSNTFTSNTTLTICYNNNNNNNNNNTEFIERYF